MTIRYLIGVGNTLRGDDALGPIVVESVRERIGSATSSLDVRMLTVVAPTPELAAEIAAAERVVFVDVARDGRIGEIICEPIDDDGNELEATNHLLMTRHGLDIPTVWRLALTLYGCQGRSWMVSTGGASFEFADSKLSVEVADRVDEIVRIVCQLLGLGER